MQTHVQMTAGEDVILIKPLYYILMKNNIGNVKQCKTFIKHAHVHVNGVICTNINEMIDSSDKVEVDGKTIESQPFVYYMLNKPQGYVCANFDKQYSCVTNLIDRDDCYCVGRLDKDTTGFVLLTNDASLSKKLLLPQNHKAKTYLVTTLKVIDEKYKDDFKNGIVIDGNVKCMPAILEIIDDFHCHVTLCEGKYHQVKKMFLSCQNKVVELKRISFAGISLDSSLKEGEYRSLTEEELRILLR